MRTLGCKPADSCEFRPPKPPSAGTTFREELANFWHQLHGDSHRGMRRRLERGLVLGDGFLVGLILVVLQDAANAFFVPTLRKVELLHAFFLRRRRSACKAFGPSGYAVITNTDPGEGSGT